MPLEYKHPLYTGCLYEGEVQGLYVQAQVFSEPSSFGIGEGRISRLTVYPNQRKEVVRCLANYERGWHGKLPEESKIRAVIEASVRQFDHKAVDCEAEASR
ncbi:hypothetical protein NYE24_30650 [Paenibacillus sp. FSL H7-0350]|uniref:DUF7678 domain-containing protein n=1 Tax=Paenibacillus sp. FSL H7-0350 TaxID=2975345 RepID=UPI0031590334